MHTIEDRIAKKIKEITRSRDFYENPCFFIHDLLKVQQQIDKLTQVLPDFCHLYYAMKANPHDKILQYMSRSSLIKGLEIASSGELISAVKYFSPDQIIFTGPGKTDWELEQCLNLGVHQIHIESLSEAARLSYLVTHSRRSSIPVLIRINLNYQLQGSHNQATGASSKFGIDEAEIYAQAQKIMDLPGLNVRGFHVFAGSGVTEAVHFNDYLSYVQRLMNSLSKSQLPISVVDIGGGFGIDYTGSGHELDVSSVANSIVQLKSALGNHIEKFILELGRYLVGESGYYVTEIIDIKISQEKKHIITAGGINHQRRPMAHKQNHPVSIISLPHKKYRQYSHTVTEEIVDIGGPLCTKVDYLAKDQWIQKAEVGDLVLVHCSGAYGQTFGHVNFLGHPLAKEYYIDC